MYERLKSEDQDNRGDQLATTMQEMKWKEKADEEFNAAEFDINALLFLSFDERKSLEQISEYEKLAWFGDVAQYTEGQSFGELALITDKSVRQATVFCMTDCYFATIEKDDYMRILRKIDAKQEFQVVEFFSRLDFLKHRTHNLLRKLIKSFNL